MTTSGLTRTCAGLAGAAMLIGTLVPATTASAKEPPSASAAESPSTSTAIAWRRTIENTLTAMRGEALAHASYHFYGEQAGYEHLPKVRALFAKTAHTELHDHFTKEAQLIHYVRDDAANLRRSIAGEMEEATRTYPRFAKEAREDKDYNAARLFTELAGDERSHARNFAKALYAITHHRGEIPEGPTVDPVKVVAGKPKVHSARTLRNLETALRGESFANASYTLYAEHARARSPKLAQLFERTAAVELTEHFAELANLAGYVHRTRENLRKSIAGETYEATKMYPGFARTAREERAYRAAALFTEIAGDEAAHARAFAYALKHLHHHGHHGKHEEHGQHGQHGQHHGQHGQHGQQSQQSQHHMMGADF
ncbi:ferritin family protein [Actinomadura sp. K4S16]|uniref:ferritin family protein n=1 Tax=Actinomadura sp. K4S16 TaxID=1316147 RepID=UPI0011EEA715|nr:ferritin family protein [Actinomadura sp. K4S16]